MVARGGEPTYTVLVRFEHEGFHCWPKAPSSRSYLRNDHRHLFKFKVELEVAHSDRDIEIHDLKETCQQWAEEFYQATREASCELMAEKLLRHLYNNWQQTWGKVECLEDGECGGGCEMSWPLEEPDTEGGAAK